MSWVRHVTHVSRPYKSESGGGASHIAGRGRQSASIYTPVCLRRLPPAGVGETAWIAAPRRLRIVLDRHRSEGGSRRRRSASDVSRDCDRAKSAQGRAIARGL